MLVGQIQQKDHQLLHVSEAQARPAVRHLFIILLAPEREQKGVAAQLVWSIGWSHPRVPSWPGTIACLQRV